METVIIKESIKEFKKIIENYIKLMRIKDYKEMPYDSDDFKK